MAKKTKTVEYEVCDRCGKEIHYKPQCDVCGKELCSSCTRRLDITIAYWRSEGGYPMGTIITSSHHEGLRLTTCVDHATEIEAILRNAGFKDFSYDDKLV